MKYKIDNNRFILFGSTPKSGCTYIRKLFNIYNNLNNKNLYEVQLLPNNYNDYKIILFIRNPYKRIVSGFLDKIVGNQTTMNINIEDLTFETFVEYMYNEKNIFDPKISTEFFIIHFIPQTNIGINDDMLIDKVFDIENIDYDYLNSLYNIKLNKGLLKILDKNKTSYNFCDCDCYNKKVYELRQMRSYPTYEHFYNESIKQKVREIYKEDFDMFEKWGFFYN